MRVMGAKRKTNDSPKSRFEIREDCLAGVALVNSIVTTSF